MSKHRHEGGKEHAGTSRNGRVIQDGMKCLLEAMIGISARAWRSLAETQTTEKHGAQAKRTRETSESGKRLPRAAAAVMEDIRQVSFVRPPPDRET